MIGMSSSTFPFLELDEFDGEKKREIKNTSFENIYIAEYVDRRKKKEETSLSLRFLNFYLGGCL